MNIDILFIVDFAGDSTRFLSTGFKREKFGLYFSWFYVIINYSKRIMSFICLWISIYVISCCPELRANWHLNYDYMFSYKFYFEGLIMRVYKLTWNVPLHLFCNPFIWQYACKNSWNSLVWGIYEVVLCLMQLNICLICLRPYFQRFNLHQQCFNYKYFIFYFSFAHLFIN